MNQFAQTCLQHLIEGHLLTLKVRYQSTLATTLVDALVLPEGKLFENAIRIIQEKSRIIERNQKRTGSNTEGAGKTSKKCKANHQISVTNNACAPLNN
jgi:hypothetical protein